MSVRRIKAGTTDVSVTLRIVDSTDGTPETGVVFNTAGIDLWYRRDLAASVDITEATLAALTTAHTDGGFLHINDGWYRLDLPDAACATGVAGVQIGGTVTGMVVFAPYIELDVNTAEDVYTRVGAPAGASVSADIAAVKVDTAAILVDTGTTLDGRIPAALVSGRMDCSVGAMAANVMTAAAAAADLTTELQSGLATAAALDAVDNFLDTEITAIISTLGTPAGASISADIAAIEAQTDDIGAAGAGLTAVPWNAAWDAEVQSEVADALDADIPAVPTAGSINDVLNDLDARLPGSGTLSILSAAAVNAEVVDALATDTYAEPGQGAPAATATLATKIGYLYKAWRNKKDNDGTTTNLYADDATTVDQKQATSEAAGTVTKGEWATGP
jgi:hypothetical protein